MTGDRGNERNVSSFTASNLASVTTTKIQQQFTGCVKSTRSACDMATAPRDVSIYDTPRSRHSNEIHLSDILIAGPLLSSVSSCSHRSDDTIDMGMNDIDTSFSGSNGDKKIHPLFSTPHHSSDVLVDTDNDDEDDISCLTPQGDLFTNLRMILINSFAFSPECDYLFHSTSCDASEACIL